MQTAATSGGTTWSTGSRVFEPERCNAEDTLFLLHTSGTTAKPKAASSTRTGGYLTYVAVTHRWIFDIQDDDV